MDIKDILKDLMNEGFLKFHDMALNGKGSIIATYDSGKVEINVKGSLPSNLLLIYYILYGFAEKRFGKTDTLDFESIYKRHDQIEALCELLLQIDFCESGRKMTDKMTAGKSKKELEVMTELLMKDKESIQEILNSIKK